MFRANYRRRFNQQQEQGFHAVSHKPYKGIGDPFYLDPKKLILHALGQWQEVGHSPSQCDHLSASLLNFTLKESERERESEITF